jgi:hypothetical protein
VSIACIPHYLGAANTIDATAIAQSLTSSIQWLGEFDAIAAYTAVQLREIQ